MDAEMPLMSAGSSGSGWGMGWRSVPIGDTVPATKRTFTSVGLLMGSLPGSRVYASVTCPGAALAERHGSPFACTKRLEDAAEKLVAPSCCANASPPGARRLRGALPARRRNEPALGRPEGTKPQTEAMILPDLIGETLPLASASTSTRCLFSSLSWRRIRANVFFRSVSTAGVYWNERSNTDFMQPPGFNHWRAPPRSPARTCADCGVCRLVGDAAIYRSSLAPGIKIS